MGAQFIFSLKFPKMGDFIFSPYFGTFGRKISEKVKISNNQKI